MIEVITYAHSGNPALAAAYDAAQPFPTRRCLSRLSYWANIRTLRAHAARFQPDLIYSSTPFYGLLQPLTRTPVVCPAYRARLPSAVSQHACRQRTTGWSPPGVSSDHSPAAKS